MENIACKAFSLLTLFISIKANGDYNLRKEEDYQRLVEHFSHLLDSGESFESALESVGFNSKPPIVRIGYLHALLSTGKIKYNYCVKSVRYHYENQFRKELKKYDSRKTRTHRSRG